MDGQYTKYFRNSRKRLRDSSSPGDTHIRTEFQRDFDRILFSTDFRRLQNKTQVLPLPECDFVHNRLTHSLETSSVGRSLGNIVGAELIRGYPAIQELGFTDYDFGFMVSSACLAHDIGNPPFGHAGEDAISDFFRHRITASYLDELNPKQRSDLQNFEGNAAGFRLLVNSLTTGSKIAYGLNLTMGTLASFAKYPKESLPDRKDEGNTSLKKYGFFQGEKETFIEIANGLPLLSHNNKSGDLAWKRFPMAYLVEAADDICYHIMDFEDGYNIGYISYELVFSLFQKILEERWAEISSSLQKIIHPKSRIAYLRSAVIQELINQTTEIFLQNQESIFKGEFKDSLLNSLKADTANPLREILRNSIQSIYQSSTVLKIEAAGYQVLPDLLDKFTKGIFEPKVYRRYYKLIPPEYRFEKASAYEKLLNITMYISSMTDRYAIELYKNLNGIELPKY